MSAGRRPGRPGVGGRSGAALRPCSGRARATGAPPLTEPGRWAAWLEGRDPVIAAFGLLRRRRGRPLVPGRRHPDRRGPAAGRRRLVGGGHRPGHDRRRCAGCWPVAQPRAGGVGRRGRGRAGDTAAGRRRPRPRRRPPRRRSSRPPPSPCTCSGRRSPPAGARADSCPAAPTGVPAPDPWTVRPGECFWTIAEDVLAAKLGRARPTPRSCPTGSASSRPTARSWPTVTTPTSSSPPRVFSSRRRSLAQWRCPGAALTEDDLATMPDDGHRYELLDGTLFVTPAPTSTTSRRHPSMLLRGARPPGQSRPVRSVRLRLPRHSARAGRACRSRSRLHAGDVEGPPLLVVEVRSPSTRRIDVGSQAAGLRGGRRAGVLAGRPGRAEPDRAGAGRRPLRRAGHGHRRRDVRRHRAVPVTVVPARLLDD